MFGHEEREWTWKISKRGFGEEVESWNVSLDVLQQKWESELTGLRLYPRILMKWMTDKKLRRLHLLVLHESIRHIACLFCK